MSRYLKKYTMFLLCISLLHLTVSSYAQTIVKGKVSSHNKMRQTTVENNQPEKIKKKKPTLRESWRKVITLRWKELSRADAWNIGAPITSVAALSLLYYYHLKNITAGNVNHNNPDQDNPGNNNIIIKNRVRLVDNEIFYDDLQNIVGPNMSADLFLTPSDFAQDNNGITSIATNNTHIITGSWDNTAKIWDIQTGQLQQTLHEHTFSVTCAAINEDKAITGSQDGTIKVWDINNGQLQHTLHGQMGNIKFVEISGNKVIGYSWLGPAKIWDANTGLLQNTFPQFNIKAIYNNRMVMQSMDTVTQLLLGDNSVQIWDTDTNQLLHTLQGHTNAISSIALNDDKVVTGSWDSTAKIWNIHTGQLQYTLQGHGRLIDWITINNNKVITSSWDGTAKIWNIDTGQLILTLKGDRLLKSKVICNDNTLFAISPNTITKWLLSINLNTPEFKNPNHPLFWIKRHLGVLQANLIARAHATNKTGNAFIIKTGVDFSKLKSTDDMYIWLTIPIHVRNYLMGRLNIQLHR